MADYLGYYQLAVFAQLMNDAENNAAKVKRYKKRTDPFVYYDDQEFKTRYRFTKETVRWLVSELRGVLNDPINKRGRPLTPEEQVLIALRFLGTGMFHRDNGDIIGVSPSSSCRAVQRVTRAIISQLKPRFLRFPRDDELPRIKQEFAQLSRDGLPGVIGAIDCTHIRLKLPNKNVMGRFFNRKQSYSLNVQAIVRPNMQFVNMVARWPGSTHDSRIFQNSRIRRNIIERNRRIGHLVGDGGYACTPYLITPFRDPADPAQERYNRAHIRARNVVERAFGVLKSRFPCLGQILRLRLINSQAVIVTCGILHNIAMEHHEPDFGAANVGRRVLNGDEPLPDDEVGSRYRDRIVENFFQ